MNPEMINNILAITAAILGLGLVITITSIVIVKKKKSKKIVKLRQGGLTVKEINNIAVIDQSDKND